MKPRQVRQVEVILTYVSGEADGDGQGHVGYGVTVAGQVLAARQMGIEPERVRLEWISASEGDRLRDVVNDMVATLKQLGPLTLVPIPTSGNGEVIEAEIAEVVG